MSLFHVLKYPISNPPSIEEMLALPKPIMECWIEFIHENNSRPWYTPELSVDILRYMLQDYEDPE